jgi:opacity protein-like surface antigen
MRSLKSLMLAGTAAVAITTAASAADLPPIIYKAPPMPVEEFSGWYLRGDIGMTSQRVKNIDNALFPGTPNLVIHDLNFEGGWLFGVGIGYQWNNWLRFDVTGEYRGETGFHGFDTWNDGTARFNDYTAKKSEWLFLANAYVDLGTWWCLTPFIGAGVGVSRNTIHSFKDRGIDPFGAPTMATGGEASKWNFAWAIHAGVAYKVNPNFNVELAYRYTYLGDAQSGDLIAFDGTNMVNNPMIFKNIDSHDVKLGVRWNLQPEPPMMPPPLVRKG